MTQDEIIEIYKQVSNKLCDGKQWCWAGVEEPLQLFAKLVAQHERERLTDAAMKAAEKGIDTAITLEREACAKVCDVLAYHPEFASDATKLAAMAIRARGQA